MISMKSSFILSNEIVMKTVARMIAVGASLLGCCISAVTASAQEFPTKPLRLVMGFGPGGLGDIVGRVLAQKMAATLGQSIIIEHMPGPGGFAAASALIKADPDGHTILWVSAQNAISASLFKSVPYDWNRDFAPIGPIGTFAYAMFAPQKSALKTVADVIAAAKADPTKFNIGSIAVGSAQHLASLRFASMSGIAVPVVPFRTTGEVVTGLISNSLQIGFENLPAVIGQVQGGELRAIAVSTQKRVPALPDVPTISEAGVPGFVMASWIGLVVHAKSPPQAVARLNAELNDALKQPDVDKRLRELLIDIQAGKPEDLSKIYHADHALWREVILKANLAQN